MCYAYPYIISLLPVFPLFHFVNSCFQSFYLPTLQQEDEEEEKVCACVCVCMTSKPTKFPNRSVQAIGLEPTRQRWESHWSNALADDIELDELITSAKITTVRLPLGHFTLGPRFCADTPFAAVADVYVNAWGEVLKLCQRLFERGVGVLLDLHALPGNANGRDHGGTSDREPGRFWGKKRSVRSLRAFLPPHRLTVEMYAGFLLS